MAFLDQFTEAQRDMLAALPYRTGLWISESDSTGGTDANEAEMRALEAIVSGFVEDFCKSQFVEEVMCQTLAWRSRWEKWRSNIETVPEECRAAVELLADKLDRKEIAAFKENLMEIAMGVAMAYREFDESSASPLEKARLYSGYWAHRLVCYFKKERVLKMHDALNISRDEQKALNALTQALQPERIEGLAVRPELEAA